MTHVEDEGCEISPDTGLDVNLETETAEEDEEEDKEEDEEEDEEDPDKFLNFDQRDLCAPLSPVDNVMLFSPADSGYGSECPSPPYGSSTSAVLAGATNFIDKSSKDGCLTVKERKVLVCAKAPNRPGATNYPTIKPTSNDNIRVGVTNCFKRPREPSTEDVMSVKMRKIIGYKKMTPRKDPLKDAAGATNCHSLKWVILTKDDFQEKLFKLRAGSHCSVCIAVSVADESNVKKGKPCIMTLSQITLPFLETHFEDNCKVYLQKKPLKNLVLDVFKGAKASFKRSTAECGHILRGVALYYVDLDIQSRGLDRKKANNKFTEFQRLDRNAGDKEAQKFAKKHNINIDEYSYPELEAKMGISLMVYDKKGYLDYCSTLLQTMNCVFYEHDDKVYMVKERSLKAFGNVFNKGKKQLTVTVSET